MIRESQYSFKSLPAGIKVEGGKPAISPGWNLLKGDIPLPAAILKESALVNNLEWMQKFARSSGVELCPHGKTTMSPEILEMQLQHGAWGVTAATASQVRAFYHFGAKRILLANQLVGKANIDIVVEVLRKAGDFAFYCLVDSVAGLKHLVKSLERYEGLPRVKLLLEVGALEGRGGVRCIEDAVEIAELISLNSTQVVLAGVEAFEGIYMGSSHEEELQKVSLLLTEVAKTAGKIDELGLFGEETVILTAGGSAYFDIVADHLSRIKLQKPCKVVLRSGCYVAHDHDKFAMYFENIQKRLGDKCGPAEGLKPALEVWGVVISRPEKTRAILNIGKRDISHDFDMPLLIATYDPEGGQLRHLIKPQYIKRLNDQHAYLDVLDDDPLRVGDYVCLGMSHPCTTFDKWRLIYVVNDSYEVRSAITTYF